MNKTSLPIDELGEMLKPDHLTAQTLQMKPIDQLVYIGQSDCCGVPVYGETDICPECGEHCNVLTEKESL